MSKIEKIIATWVITMILIVVLGAIISNLIIDVTLITLGLFAILLIGGLIYILYNIWK